MSTNRIQKLLFSEYCDFEDMVLLESPFAETTRDGKGIRQVQMGLTPTKLILATDILKSADDEISYAACLEAGKIGIDPEIESLELVSVFPVEAVNLSVFRKKRRNTLKAHFCNDIVLYFELGGIDKRRMFWNLWRERVKFLSPNEGASSLSETSVGSTSSVSTLYIADSSLAIPENGKTQLFCNYHAIIPDPTRLEPSTTGWKDKDLYLGPDYSVNDFSPADSLLDSMKLSNKQSNSQCPYNIPEDPPIRLRSVSSASVLERGPSCMHFVNRFGYGVPESAATLYFIHQNEENCQQDIEEETCQVVDMYEVVESGVTTWENGKRKHIRRYAFAPQPHFLHGLGPWKVTPGETYSVQIKRAVSMVSIRRQPADRSFRLPISRRQLTTTVSCEALHIMPEYNPARISNIKFISPTSPVVFFWTPDYWYRPRSASGAYNELQNHLLSIHNMHDSNSSMLERSSTNVVNEEKISSDSGIGKHNSKSTNASTLSKKRSKNKRKGKHRMEGTSKLRRLLKMDETYTAWDFDSSTIAYQLTMIDRDLFLKIPVIELATLIWQQSSKFAPNVGALIAFSHRISCLIATEILRESELQKRARLIARYINVADKCHKLRNYQSTRSILCGLQSPPVYRLRETWSYVRHHHATKYQRLETMCRRYRDPRLPIYQQMFKQGTLTPPFLPSVAHIVCTLLDRLEEFPEAVLLKYSPSSSNDGISEGPSYCNVENNVLVLRSEDELEPVDKSCAMSNSWKNYLGKSSVPKSLQRILSAFRIWPSHSDVSNCTSEESCREAEQISNQSSLLEAKLNRFFSTIKTEYDSDTIRTHHLEQVSTAFIMWQKSALLYALQENSKAKEYLLKARYREDKENFKESIKLEPINTKNEE